MKLLKGNSGDVEILLSFKEDTELEGAKELFSFLKEKEFFKAGLGEVYADLGFKGSNKVILGLGEREKLDYQGLRKAFHKLGLELMKQKVESAHVEVPKFEGLCYKKTIASAAEGILHSEYAFEKYLTEKKTKPSVKEFSFYTEEKEESLEKGLIEAENLIEGIFLARDLVNEPAIYMTPSKLAEMAVSELEPLGVEVKVYGYEEIKEMKMEAFLAVSKGSSQEPKFIVMNWKGNPSDDFKIALVGKGLTYDSGGYSLKPSASMDTMFCDMGGAGSVIGAMKSIAKSKLEKNVVAIVAACENMISGAAYKPGDIISSMAGKTIEVLNTDAEGRLTLADALYYAATVEKADQIVDIATLTGACVVALGHITTGAVTNNDEFMEEVSKASERAGEYIWQMPSHPEYKEMYKGTNADLANVGGKGAGTISAGLFLSEFVEETPWVHLDIAGTAYLPKAEGYLPKGASGVPVATLYNIVKGCNCSK